MPKDCGFNRGSCLERSLRTSCGTIPALGKAFHGSPRPWRIDPPPHVAQRFGTKQRGPEPGSNHGVVFRSTRRSRTVDSGPASGCHLRRTGQSTPRGAFGISRGRGRVATQVNDVALRARIAREQARFERARGAEKAALNHLVMADSLTMVMLHGGAQQRETRTFQSHPRTPR